MLRARKECAERRRLFQQAKAEMGLEEVEGQLYELRVVEIDEEEVRIVYNKDSV